MKWPGVRELHGVTMRAGGNARAAPFASTWDLMAGVTSTLRPCKLYTPIYRIHRVRRCPEMECVYEQLRDLYVWLLAIPE